MDLKQIHELIKIINKSNIGEISIEDKDGKVTIKQKEEPALATQPQQVYNIPGTLPFTAPLSASAQQSVSISEAKTDNLITIKSPMIGTFYRRPTPDKPNFAEIGTQIEPGKVLCVIEAMKLFNEIEAEVRGTIVKILVDDNSPVEYDQPLFLVEPN
jgi:acetyl-CoA carboxylase biotin carboxyl carrier protein